MLYLCSVVVLLFIINHIVLIFLFWFLYFFVLYVYFFLFFFFFFFFFFKQKTAYEIKLVTGVQTCALPILSVLFPDPMVWIVAAAVAAALWLAFAGYLLYERLSVEYTLTSQRLVHKTGILRRVANRIEMKIGRASCRERGEMSVGAEE